MPAGTFDTKGDPGRRGRKCATAGTGCRKSWKSSRAGCSTKDEQRINLLGVVLENVGTDRAVQLGDSATWAASIKAKRRRTFLGDRFSRIMCLMVGLNAVLFVVVVCLGVPASFQRIIDVLLAGAVSYVVSLGIHVFLDD